MDNQAVTLNHFLSNNTFLANLSHSQKYDAEGSVAGNVHASSEEHDQVLSLRWLPHHTRLRWSCHLELVWKHSSNKHEAGNY